MNSQGTKKKKKKLGKKVKSIQNKLKDIEMCDLFYFLIEEII